MSFWQGRRVLVTGGAGFVGSQLVLRLVRERARVVVLDNLFTGTLQNLKAIEGQYHFVPGSVTDGLLMHNVVRECEVVFHLAVRNIIVSTSKPREDLECNAGGTLNVLLAAQLYKPRVVYTSSVSVHGQVDLPINHRSSISPLSPYAISKLCGECYCRLAWQVWEVPVVIVRLSNCYGPGQSPSNSYCGVVSKFMAAAQANGSLSIYDDGKQTRDYVYIEDVVEALLQAAEHPEAPGKTMVLGTGKETSVNYLASQIQALYGQGKIIHVPKRDIDNVRRRCVDSTEATRVLGWQAKVALATGLSRTKEWLGT